GPRTWPTNAVLATLSSRYPPSKGTLPTCYSPVRRFTRDRSPVLARLACVTPAANVRSEPGSNSPIKLWRFSRDSRLGYSQNDSTARTHEHRASDSTREPSLVHRSTIQFSEIDPTRGKPRGGA